MYKSYLSPVGNYYGREQAATENELNFDFYRTYNLKNIMRKPELFQEVVKMATPNDETKFRHPRHHAAHEALLEAFATFVTFGQTKDTVINRQGKVQTEFLANHTRYSYLYAEKFAEAITFFRANGSDAYIIKSIELDKDVVGLAVFLRDDTDATKYNITVLRTDTGIEKRLFTGDLRSAWEKLNEPITPNWF